MGYKYSVMLILPVNKDKLTAMTGLSLASRIHQLRGYKFTLQENSNNVKRIFSHSPEADAASHQ